MKRETFHGVSVRTDDAIDQRLDRLALAASAPGKRTTRGAAARLALLAGLDALEGGHVEAIASGVTS